MDHAIHHWETRVPRPPRNGRLNRHLVRLLGAILVASLLPASPVAAAPSAAPVLTSPAAGATVTANPVLSWRPVVGAVRYRFQMSLSAGFETTFYSVETPNLRFAPPRDLPTATLHWRVAGIDAGNGLGPYATGSFTRTWASAPNPTAPADGATLEFPRDPLLFTWDPLAGALGYEVQIDDAPDFVGAMTLQTKNPSVTLREPQTVGQSFYWHVRGVSDANGVSVNSAWSPTRRYSVAWPSVPVLVTPANDTSVIVEDVVLDWEPVLGAAVYQVQVNPNPDFTNNMTLDIEVKGTRYSPPVTFNNAAYYWRVRSRDVRGNYGGWSDVWSFTRGWPDRPTANTPQHLEYDVATLTYSWTPVDHAAYYEIQVGSDKNFTEGTFVNCYTNHTEYTPYRTVLSTGEPGHCSDMRPGAGQVVYWHVRGIDSHKNVLGRWSNVSTVDVNRFAYDPTNPVPVSPADGETVTVPVLRWQPVHGTERYHVAVYKASGALVAETDTYTTSWVPPTTLTPADGPFAWYVRSVDFTSRHAMTPDTSQWQHFTLVAAPTPTASAPTPRLPANGAGSVRMPLLTWDPIPNAASYEVWYGIDGGPSQYKLNPGRVPYPAYAHAAESGGSAPHILPVDRYFWYVRAFDRNGSEIHPGTTGFVQTSTFEILPVDNLGTGDYVAPAPKCTPLTTCTAIADTPTLRWNHTPWAGFYKVYVALDPNFTNVVRIYETQFDRLTPRESYLDNRAGQSYYWFVRPCKNAANCGEYTERTYPSASAFQKRSAPVKLLAPANGASVANEITFTWEDFLATNSALTPPVTQEARSYRVEVSTVTDFATLVDSREVDQTTYTAFESTYPEGRLFWRVVAIDGSGNELTRSAARELTKHSPGPSLALPAHGATVSGVPYLRWTPLPYAARYRVEMAREGDIHFSPSNLVFSEETTMAAFVHTGALPAGLYAWRVYRIDGHGKPGAWSPARTFTLRPAAPALLSPPSGAPIADDVLFAWSTVPGAARYRFESSSSPDFTSIRESVDTVMTSWAPTHSYPEGTWHWRARVLDTNGNALSTSTSRSVIRDSVAPTVTASTPASSAPITGGFKLTFSEAVKGVSATSFRMHVAGTTSYVAGTVSPTVAASATTGTTTATFTPSTPLVPGESYVLTVSDAVTDLAGNRLPPYTRTVRTALLVENTSVALRFAWDRDTDTAASGGGYDASRTAGTRTAFTFTGTTVSIVARRAPDGGLADVYLDNVKQTATPVSFYNSTAQNGVVVWTRSGLTNARHTVELRVLGTKPAGSQDAWVYLDAFRIGTVTYEETHANVLDSAVRVATTGPSGGSFDRADHRVTGDSGTAPTVTLPFKGTGVALYATKGPGYGRATVSVDGVVRATVDLYAAATTHGQLVFDSSALPNGRHTVVLTLTGAKSASSTGTEVDWDRFVVR